MKIKDLDLIMERNPDLGDRGFQSDGRSYTMMSKPTELKDFKPTNKAERLYAKGRSYLVQGKPKMARHFLEIAYEMGNFGAGNDLAYGLSHGWFDNRDQKTSTKIFEKLALSGDRDAMNNYAFSCLEGRGTKKDVEKAEYWMWRAVIKGNIHAAASFGQLIFEGTFTEHSIDEGLRLCFWAADYGESGAMNDIGLCYEEGVGLRRDFDKAFEWFKKSVEHGGGACAEFNVSRCYRFGLGVEVDEEKADAWQNLAVEHGFDIEAYNKRYDL